MPPYRAPPPPQVIEPSRTTNGHRSVNGNGSGNGRGWGVNGNGTNNGGGGKGQGRGAPPQRSTWSYGPGAWGVDFPSSVSQFLLPFFTVSVFADDEQSPIRRSARPGDHLSNQYEQGVQAPPVGQLPRNLFLRALPLEWDTFGKKIWGIWPTQPLHSHPACLGMFPGDLG
ncbi:hypothetical protein B0H17DRAFT_1178529 [Mycena rosella]|uniref:Uncharacterized protein n=1 Tax=Mycena rosella TaxID=1033263 RepID=A0AAD7DM04_MYCRO|nr:hypothetical protein B0H17DRAFT_1178529 [Mycena rosella]